MIMKVKSTLNRITGVLATGYILMFYSEHLFWAHVRPGDDLAGWLMTWLVYSLLGFVFLTLVKRFHAESIWAIFLCGAVFGWLAEGLVVQTTYENLPLSISFTGLAWHASISVLVGWLMVRRALQSGFKSTCLLSVLIGVLYGLWAISWWNEPGERITPVPEFALYALVTQGLVILAYWINEHTIAVGFEPNRVIEINLGILVLAYFIFVTIPAAPQAAWILPGLLMTVLLVLRNNLRNSRGEPQIRDGESRIPMVNYFGLLALPFAAVSIYALSHSLGIRWHTNWILYLITTPLGFLLLGISLLQTSRKTS